MVPLSCASTAEETGDAIDHTLYGDILPRIGCANSANETEDPNSKCPSQLNSKQGVASGFFQAMNYAKRVTESGGTPQWPNELGTNFKQWPDANDIEFESTLPVKNVSFTPRLPTEQDDCT